MGGERRKAADLGAVFESAFGFSGPPACLFQSGGQSPGSYPPRCSLPESSWPFPTRSRQAGVEGATLYPLLAEVTDEWPCSATPVEQARCCERRRPEGRDGGQF